jgi:hypothetical protein
MGGVKDRIGSVPEATACGSARTYIFCRSAARNFGRVVSDIALPFD